MYISRQIAENISEQLCINNLMQVLPVTRFFVPTQKFWDSLSDVMDKHSIKMVLEGGAGAGHLLEESTEHNIKMAGCDVIKRKNHFEGNHLIQIMPAHMFPDVPDSLWLVCRPDHSGWARALLEQCQEENKIFIYVGLRKNMAMDLGSHMMESTFTTFTEVGEEGEEMLVFTP